MRVRIHRGTKEIGGTCVELESQGKRIVLDVGLPLDVADPDMLPHTSRPSSVIAAVEVDLPSLAVLRRQRAMKMLFHASDLGILRKMATDVSRRRFISEILG